MGLGSSVTDGMEGTSSYFRRHGSVYACSRASVTMEGQKSKFCISSMCTVRRKVQCARTAAGERMGLGSKVFDSMEGTSSYFRSHGSVCACARAGVTMHGQKSKFCASYECTVRRF